MADSITCPKCGKTSHHPADVAHRYCGNCHEHHDNMSIVSACPTCGVVMSRSPYSIGSGPELACSNCEWCWGAAGQDLQPITMEQVVHDLGFDPRIPSSEWPSAST